MEKTSISNIAENIWALGELLVKIEKRHPKRRILLPLNLYQKFADFTVRSKLNSSPEEDFEKYKVKLESALSSEYFILTLKNGEKNELFYVYLDYSEDVNSSKLGFEI